MRKAGNAKKKKKTEFYKNESFPGLPLHSPEPCDLAECLSWSKRSKGTPGPVCALSPAVQAVTVRGLRLLVQQAVHLWADSPQRNELCLGSHGGELGVSRGGFQNHSASSSFSLHK